MLTLGLKVLGMEADQLPEVSKGQPEKLVLAWWLSRQTTITISRRWASQRLWMGDESRVTQAIRRVKEGRGGGLEALRRRLEKADIEDYDSAAKNA